MRNYLYSVCAHIVLILLLLYPFLNKYSEVHDLNHIVLVEFSPPNEDEEVAIRKEVTSAPVLTSPSKEPAKKQEIAIPKPADTKAIPKPPDTKPKAEVAETKVKVEVAEVISAKATNEPEESIRAKKAAEELARKQREMEDKVAKFTSLLNQSKQSSEKSDTDNQETRQKKSDTGTLETNSPSNIQGIIGARKVLRIPTIKDDSQKRGRVVVKICVGPEGNVISANYTQIGSTTSDTYLIGLAEKGASEYLFSPSDNPRECGKVVIEFELK